MQKQLEVLDQIFAQTYTNETGTTAHLHKLPQKIADLRSRCTFFTNPKSESDKGTFGLLLQGADIQLHPVNYLCLNMLPADIICYNCFQAVLCFINSVIPLKNNLAATISPHPQAFLQSLEYIEQAMSDLEEHHQQYNMRAHAAKEEARTNDENNEGSELSSDDEMSTLQHHSDEEAEVVEHELPMQLDVIVV